MVIQNILLTLIVFLETAILTFFVVDFLQNSHIERQQQEILDFLNNNGGSLNEKN